MATKGSKNKTAWTAKDVYEMLYSTYGRSHTKAIAARKKEASKYTIPYIPEKEIMLTTGRYNTGKISTNLLDSIYNAAKRTNTPIDIALGLAGRESTLGIGRGFKRGQGVTSTDLYSNWQQVQPIPNTNAQVAKYNEIVAKENAGEELTDEDYQFKSDFIMRGQNALENIKVIKENPIDNALKFYQTGKYNPGDKRHSQMVEEDARILMSDPAIQKWLQTKNNNQMKCGGRRKAQLGLDIQYGGRAIPIARNMVYFDGNSHATGGIGVGNNLEVEGGEVGEKKGNTLRIFSAVPFLGGASPAQLVMGGANPNTVFKAQEAFKDKNRIKDDGTRYEIGGEKIYTPSKSIQRQIQETGKITISGAPTIGGLRTRAYMYGLKQAIKYPTKVSNVIRNIGNKIKQNLVDKSFSYKPDFIPMETWKYATGRVLNQQVVGNKGSAWIRTGKIINDAINNEEKRFGGNMIYEINGNVKNGLMSARPKARLGKTVKINMDSYETVDEAVEKYKQLYRIRYGKEPSKSDINRVAWTKSLENAVNGDPNLITGYGPNVGVRRPNVAKIVSNTNKGKQIARTQTTVRNKTVKSATPQKQAVNTKVSEAARVERQSQFDAWQQGEAFKASTMPTDAVAVNRPTISTGVRSGRKGRIDDAVAIERSQRGVDPLASKPEGNIYDKQYAKRYQNKISQTANILAGTGAAGVSGGYILSGGNFNNEENNLNDENKQNTKSINNNTTNNNSSVSNNKKPNYTINGTFDNARPQYYAEKRLPIAGSQSIAEKAGLARSGWSYADNEPISLNYMPNINLSIPTNYVKAVGDNSKKSTSSTPRGGNNAPKTTAVEYPSVIRRDEYYSSNEPKGNSTPTDESYVARQSRGIQAVNEQSPSSTGGGKQSNSDGRWIPQFNPITTRDWIGLGSNLAGHIASYFTNNSLLSKYPMPTKPVMAQAAKLKTTYNINPELTNNREVELTNRGVVRRNTQSSNTSIAREQRIMNEARNARNQLYGRKENIETQLINQDRLNRQSVHQRNVAAYNDWLDKTFVAKNNKLLAKQQNMMNLISGIPMAVNSIIGNIESRQATNNTIKAIAAANPNVDGRLLGIGDYYTQRLGDGRVAVYDKNGKLKKYV